MNPFDQPPSGAPVSSTPPSGSGHDSPRRGRIAIAALAAAGLVSGGIVVAGQFAAADDRPTLASVDDSVPGSDDVPDTTEAEPDSQTSRDERGGPSIDGEIVLDDGDGDPVVIDLGELGECVGPILQGGPFGRFGHDERGRDGDGPPRPPFDEDFHRRMEEFLDGLEIDGLGELDDDGVRIFGSGGSTVTVVGPDGVEVIDLGDGDATVTIEQSDGELTIETDGAATVSELPDVGELLPNLGDGERGERRGGVPLPGIPALPGLEHLESCLDDLDE